MPEAGIPGPAAVNLPAPRNRMVRAHLAALVGALVETRDHRRLAARAARVIVELIGDPPGDRGGGAERTREAHDAGLQAGRMALELRPEELPVPGPVVSGVGRRMDAEVTAARFDEIKTRITRHASREDGCEFSAGPSQRIIAAPLARADMIPQALAGLLD